MTHCNKSFADDDLVTKVAADAVAHAIEKHRRLGQSVVVLREGEIVWLSPAEIAPRPLPHDNSPPKVLAEDDR